MPASANNWFVFLTVTSIAKIDSAFPAEQSSICTLLIIKEKFVLR